ncbi:MAG TPA: methyltransferase domain-containing protein [Tepidisphaeraceae bacterium]|jgi:SAM-dependent methyltransferase|nr:methyltransferase domain-containing protein [Tepidisphaeraceae bacterium]
MLPTVTSDPKEIWTRIAPWWDNVLGEGNEFQLQLIMPATDRLLAVRPGDRILDLACGNGNYSRRLARAGANVLAVDVAEPFIQAARRRTTQTDGQIEYRTVDLTDDTTLNQLGSSEEFDAAVCSMALMDLPTLDPLLNRLITLLKPGGRFVFSIPHPCFNSPRVRMTAELINQDGKPEQLYGLTVFSYLDEQADLSFGMLNQPEPHYLYHRPLSLLIRTFAKHGFLLDALEEPSFPTPSGGGGKNAFSWKMRPNIPPALVTRMLKPQ